MFKVPVTCCNISASHSYFVDSTFTNKIKNKSKINTVRIIPKSKNKIPNRQIHDRSLSWLGTGTSIKSILT